MIRISEMALLLFSRSPVNNAEIVNRRGVAGVFTSYKSSRKYSENMATRYVERDCILEIREECSCLACSYRGALRVIFNDSSPDRLISCVFLNSRENVRHFLPNLSHFVGSSSINIPYNPENSPTSLLGDQRKFSL